MKRFFVSGTCLLGTMLAAACGGGQSSESESPSSPSIQPQPQPQPPSSPHGSPLISLGTFQGKYIASQRRMIVEPLGSNPLSSLASTPSPHTASADPDTHIPASSTGVPTPNPPGGILAYSPAGGAYSGTCPGTEPNRYCGTVRMVNRYSEGGAPTTLRNVYATITSITSGYSQVSSTRNTFGDSDRSAEFGAAVTSANGGLWYYGHLSPSDYPSPTLQPGANEDIDTGGFRVDRTWSFTGPGGDFAFTFEVYGYPVACAFAAGTAEDPYNAPLSDRNCDGVVAGSRSLGVFVANGMFSNGAPRGNDVTGMGTLRRPVATIKRGLDTQGSNPARTGVYTAASTFNEVSALNLKTTPQWLGGFDSDNGFARNSGASTAVVSLQLLASTRVSSTTPSLLQSISLQSANGATVSGTGTSSLPLIVTNSLSLLTLDQVTLHAGLGGIGSNGAIGALGRAGNDGVAGSLAALGSGGVAGTCTFGGTPGAGGDGSANTMPDPFLSSPNGSAGMSSSSGALGGGGGAGGDPDFCVSGVQSNGGIGGVAGQGSNGGNGAAASLFSGTMLTAGGTYNALLASGNAGISNGAPGAGGGGGGAGGAMDNDGSCGANTASGGGGGGAGSGGCGSSMGSKGFGGGASFGLSILNSAVAARTVFIVTDGGGRGGNGGSGGAHGLGGLGKSGGTTTSDFGFTSTGGAGSNGSTGGHGSNASGGNGGPSFCLVVKSGSTLTETTPIACTFGVGGLRGVGGNADPTQSPGGAPFGQAGPAAIRFDY